MAKWGMPTTLAAASGKLLVTVDGRVDVFNSIPTVSGAAADVAVGANGFVVQVDECAADDLAGVAGIFVVNGKLLVADSGHSRVLIWNSIPTASGTPADLVLGQADFTHCLRNGGGGLSASTLDKPVDVWTDGTRVAVVDMINQRVHIAGGSEPRRRAAAVHGAPLSRRCGRGR